MKILSSYKKMAKELIKEAAWDRKFGEPLPTLSDVMKEASQDDDDYVSIGFGKFKEKDSVDDPTAPTFKKDDSGAFVPAKGGDDEKGDDKGGEEKPKPSGKELGKGDFERDDVEEESITINGQKYKPIKESKESNSHTFKEIYKRIGVK